MGIVMKWAIISCIWLTVCARTCPGAPGSAPETKTPIRVAFPTATLINGHIGQVLLHTDILEKNGLQGTVTGFQSGPPMMEALISGKVDVAFTSEVPAIVPLSKGHRASIIATFGSLGRTAIMVTGDSAVASIKDLKGRKIAVPFGTSPHRNLIGMLKKAGLDPATDAAIVNIGKDDLAPVVTKGGVDAIVPWDPAVEQYARKFGFRIIEALDFFSVCIMNDGFIDRDPAAARRFLSALKEAVFYMASHKAQANAWFAEASRLDMDIIDACGNVNRNYRDVRNLSDVYIAVDDAFIDMLQESARFSMEYGVIASPVDIRTFIDNDLNFAPPRHKR